MKLRVDAAQLANDKLMAGQLAAALATADIVDKTWTSITDKLAEYYKKDGTSITINNGWFETTILMAGKSRAGNHLVI
mgnify:CR=1 FL=1